MLHLTQHSNCTLHIIVCPLPLIQYIRTALHIAGRSSIHNFSTRHVVVTGPTDNSDKYKYVLILETITVLIMKQLNTRCIYITLYSDIKHVTCC